MNANWSSVAILYQENVASTIHLQGLLMDEGIEILARHVDGNDFRTILTDIKQHNAFNILLDIQPGLLTNLFKECQ